MKFSSRKFPLIPLLFTISSCSYADITGVKVGTNHQQRLIIENLNLSGVSFFTAYMSKDIQQRQLSEMYLAGVLDSGEGILWCGYSVALPSSLQEVIYMGFKNKSQDSLNRRTSEIINEVLASKLPCRTAK